MERIPGNPAEEPIDTSEASVMQETPPAELSTDPSRSVDEAIGRFVKASHEELTNILDEETRRIHKQREKGKENTKQSEARVTPEGSGKPPKTEAQTVSENLLVASSEPMDAHMRQRDEWVGSQRERSRKGGAKAKAKHYGTNESLSKKIGVSALKSVASVFGVRSIWEGGKLAMDWWKGTRKKEREHIHRAVGDLLTATLEGSQTREVFISKEVEKIAEEHKHDPSLQKEGDTRLAEKGIERFTPEADEEMQKWYREVAKKNVTEAKNNERKGVPVEQVGKKGPVLAKAQELQARLKETKMPPDEKKALRLQMGRMLREYRRDKRSEEKVTTDKISDALELYINNKAQKMLVVKEALNTATLVSGVGGLRSVVYAGAAVTERIQKAATSYDKEHFRNADGAWSEKFKVVAKSLFFDSVKETARGFNILGIGKDARGGFQRGTELASSLGVMMRAFGIVNFDMALLEGKAFSSGGAQKLVEAFWEQRFDDTVNQMGENWVSNAKRLFSYIGMGANIPETPSGASVALNTDYRSFKESLDGPQPPTPEEIARGAEQEYRGRSIMDQLKMLQEQEAVAATGVGGSGGGMSGTAATVEFPGVVDAKVSAALASGKFGNADDIKNAIASAQTVGMVKPGGSVSEALHHAMSGNEKITVVNPDGTVLHNFDANLAHAGDTVVMNKEGAITVYKTSEVSVRAGMSLEGRYDEIAQQYKLNEIPQEVLNDPRFNKGQGYWGGKMTSAEAASVREWWDTHKGDYEHVHNALGKVYTPEQIEKIKIPDDASWPPTDGRTDAERIAPEPWSDQVRKGGEFQVRADPGAGLGDEFDESDAASVPAGERVLAAEAPAVETLPAYERLAEIFRQKNIVGMAGDQAREATDLQAKFHNALGAPAKDIIDDHWSPGTTLQDEPYRLNVKLFVEDLGSDGNAPVPNETLGEYIARATAEAPLYAQISKEASGNMHAGLAGIFHYEGSDPSKVMELKEWREIKGISAQNMLDGKFGKHFNLIDAQTDLERERFFGVQKYAQELLKKNETAIFGAGEFQPQPKETIGHYIQRMEWLLSKKKSGV